MLDLCAFLAARILEDEADIGREASTADYCDAAEGVHLPTRRALAECEAKRDILHLHQDAAPWCGWSIDPTTTHGDFAEDGSCDTLRALAQVYADHPDYSDEWRL